MVIIRESPRARPSPAKPQVQWPPASPFQALISSPSGRKKWKDLQEEQRARSISPSNRARPAHNMHDEDSVDVDDEESLKLKLEILETKQKLKELEKKKRNKGDMDTPSRSENQAWSPSKRRRLLPPMHEGPASSIQVPLSPSRAQFSAAAPVSPARVRLGIDSARAEGVSLKRPSNVVNTNSSNPIAKVKVDRPISSFSQRLANVRTTVQEKQDKSDRLDSIRSKTFAGVQSKEDSFKATPVPVKSFKHLIDSRPLPNNNSAPASSTTKSTESKRRVNSHDPAFYDPFSELHLSTRNISHTDVAKSLAGCEIYTLPRLLKEVVSPHYEPPDCESDYVVFGILSEKTQPFQQAEHNKIHDRHKNEDGTRMAKNKFMVLRLCDLKWEIDCYLFGTGFEQYWKLTEGTLLAILNPAIMPPKINQHNGRFSLKIASSEDRIMELGKARDLGYCTSIKKDGKKCTSWVNKQKSQHCEFHVNLALNQARKGRMEVNAMWRGQSPDRKPKQKWNPNMTMSSEYGQLWSVGGINGKSAASMLDDDDTDALHNLSKVEASRKRIAGAQQERDLAKKLGSMGGGVGGVYLRAKHGIAEGQTDAAPGDAMFAKPTASELGLLSKKADDQRLSPAKDRRRHFGIGAVSSAGREAMGWGGAGKYGLLKPRESKIGSPERGQEKISLQARESKTISPERGQTRITDSTRARSALQAPLRERSLSPKKKARFMLERGVREPGRESGGYELSKENEINDDNDDDDLDIV